MTRASINNIYDDFPTTYSYRYIYCATLIKIALVSWFFIFVFLSSPVKAEESAKPACTGPNMLEQLKSDDREAYDRIVKSAEETPNSNGVFWKIEKDGVAPSYLLGTMHISDPRVSVLSPERQQYLDQANTVIIETTDILDKEAAQKTMAKMKHLTMITDGTTLEDRLPKDLWDDLEAETSRHKIPYFLAKRMQPWIIGAAISIPLCEAERKQAGNEILDNRIANSALANNQKLVGLETSEEQLSVMAAIPQDMQLKSLEELLKLDYKTRDNLIFTMIDMYLEEKVSQFMPMARELSLRWGNSPDNADFEQKVITDRNHTMVNRAEEHLNKGGVFMAVGALHLPGKEGIVQLLIDDGYTLSPV